MKIYITRTASIHADVPSGHAEVLHAVEPDYKALIPQANLRRRMSRMVRMGVACGLQCLGDVSPQAVDALITATGLGCLGDTEKFMNNLLDDGERLLNPTPFMQSTFNTIGAQLALLLHIQTYNVTYVHRGLSLASALTDAVLHLHEGKHCILVGAIDEWTDTAWRIERRLGLFRDYPAGEGAHFFLLSDDSEGACAELMGIDTFRPADEAAAAYRIHSFLSAFGLRSDQVHTDDFRHRCGDYPTADGYGLYEACRSEAPYVLLHNAYLGNHSLLLVRRLAPC